MNGASESNWIGVAREEEIVMIDKEVLTEVSHAVLVSQCHNETKIPIEISELRRKRNELIRDNKIELTRKFKFDRYAFSRLTDNRIFEYTRYYLAAFVEGQFRHIQGLTRTACEIWLRNEGLPNRESLEELCFWFLKERGIESMYHV